MGRRVGFGVSLTGAMAASALMQFAIGAAGPFLVEEFQITALQLGGLSTMFYVFATSGSWVAGGFSDRIGAKPALVTLFVLAALAFILLAVAPGYLLLGVAVSVAGLSMALANPATNELVARHAEPSRRGSLLGAKQSGVQLAALMAGLLIPLVALATGWRWALGLCVVPVVACLLLTFVSVPQTPSRSRDSEDRGGIWSFPNLARLVAFGLFSGAAYASVIAYLPLYAVDVMTMTPFLAGQLLAVLGLIGVISRMLWVRAVDRIGPGGVPAALTLIAACSVVATLSVALAPVLGEYALWIAVVLYGAGVAAWTVVGMYAVLRRLGPWSAARVSGVVISGYYGGLLVSPLIFGSIVGEGSHYGYAWNADIALFVAGLAIAVHWWYRQRAAAGVRPA